MLNSPWNIWQALMRIFLRGDEDDDDDRDEGPVELAFQIGCLIVASLVGVAALLAWLSRR